MVLRLRLVDHARPDDVQGAARLRRLPRTLARAGRRSAYDARPCNVFSQIAIFFSTMAVVTFGGAYAVLAYVAQQAVEYGWLRPGRCSTASAWRRPLPGR